MISIQKRESPAPLNTPTPTPAPDGCQDVGSNVSVTLFSRHNYNQYWAIDSAHFGGYVGAAHSLHLALPDLVTVERLATVANMAVQDFSDSRLIHLECGEQWALRSGGVGQFEFQFAFGGLLW